MRSLYLKTKSNKAIATIVVNCIESENLHELLRLTIHSKLTFESHINKLCKKASQKLDAFAEISNYIAFDKRRH